MPLLDTPARLEWRRTVRSPWWLAVGVGIGLLSIVAFPRNRQLVFYLMGNTMLIVSVFWWGFPGRFVVLASPLLWISIWWSARSLRRIHRQRWLIDLRLSRFDSVRLFWMFVPPITLEVFFIVLVSGFIFWSNESIEAMKSPGLGGFSRSEYILIRLAASHGTPLGIALVTPALVALVMSFYPERRELWKCVLFSALLIGCLTRAVEMLRFNIPSLIQAPGIRDRLSFPFGDISKDVGLWAMILGLAAALLISLLAAPRFRRIYDLTEA